MEKRINKQVANYISKFKEDIVDFYENNGKKVKEMEEIKEIKMEENVETDKMEESATFKEFVHSYPPLLLAKTDFSNNRVKSFIPPLERCVANKSCKEQCTRRKKEGNYCGTHAKGTPHGIISNDNPLSYLSSHKVTIWAQNIQGILYYIDDENNVYNVDDILKEVINPKIIAKYKQCNDVYLIDYFL
jgi:hypothetical protein